MPDRVKVQSREVKRELKDEGCTKVQKSKKFSACMQLQKGDNQNLRPINCQLGPFYDHF